jgi:acetoin utilization protein AcuB
MRVRDLMTPNPISVPAGTPFATAREVMATYGIRHLPITRGEVPIGILSDRDIRLALPSPATSLSVWEVNFLLATLCVDDVMTTPIITVDPDCPSREAAAIMLQHRIGALVVLEGHRLIGILTETDLVRAHAEGGAVLRERAPAEG